VAESVIPNKYRQHGTIYSQLPSISGGRNLKRRQARVRRDPPNRVEPKELGEEPSPIPTFSASNFILSSPGLDMRPPTKRTQRLSDTAQRVIITVVILNMIPRSIPRLPSKETNIGTDRSYITKPHYCNLATGERRERNRTGNWNFIICRPKICIIQNLLQYKILFPNSYSIIMHNFSKPC
jgi:hypothetical protein